jgi:putative ABC transport system substrate-binding protein
MNRVDKQHYAGQSTAGLRGLLGLAFLLAHVNTTLADTAVTQKFAMGQGKTSIAVIYPDIGDPYRTVFAQIIGGIEGKAKTQVGNYPIGPNADVDELKNNLRRQDVKVVIALGRQGMKVASTLDRNIGVVVGGVITSPENVIRDLPVNSLSPDPELLFSHLKVLMPGVRRVFVVYDSRQNGWLISLARESARAQGIELVAYEAQDLRGAVHIYQDIFTAADSRHDALWLLQDSTTVEDGSVLPLVLHESWVRNIAVFSSSIAHVRRGVLFSLYPDNIEMGRHLADSALGFLASGEYREHGIVLLREVLMAINLRTADHLGLKASRKQEYGMVFPEQ